MSGIIKSLMVKVGVDLTEMQKGFKQAGKELKAVGKDFTKVGTSMTRGLTLPIVGAGVAAVKFASDTEESLNKVRVAFGGSAKQVEDFADTTLESFGIARGTALDMAATFGDMGTSMGLTSGEAADMSISMTGLAGDLASFKNIGIDEAVTALNGVFTGETESLKRLGIVMLDATLETYRLEKGITKSYKSMSQAEKVALRYEYVMDATKNAQGDFVRTGGGVANQLRVVQESLKQAAAALGEQLLPAVADILKEVNKAIKVFTNLDEGTKSLIIKVGLLVAAVGPVLSVFGKLSLSASGLFAGIAKGIGVLSGGGGLIAALGAVVSPAGLAAAAIVGIGVAIIAIRSSESFKSMQFLKDFKIEVKELADAFEEQKDKIKDNSKVASDLADELYALSDKENKTNEEKGKMIALVTQLNDLIPELNLQLNKETFELDKQIGSVKELIRQKEKEYMMQAYEERIVALYKSRATAQEQLRKSQTELTAAQDAWDKADKRYVQSYPKFMYAIEQAEKKVNEYGATLNALDNNITGIYNDMYEVGKDIGQGMVDGMDKKLVDVKRSAERLANSIPKTVKKIMLIESPSKVMAGLGEHVSSGFALGIKDNIGLIKDSAVEMSEAAVPTVSRPAFGASMERSASNDIEMGVFRAVSQAMGQQKTGDHFVIQIGGKTILDTVITEKQRRDSRAGKSIALTV